jgi:hypothetical protein
MGSDSLHGERVVGVLEVTDESPVTRCQSPNKREAQM